MFHDLASLQSYSTKEPQESDVCIWTFLVALLILLIKLDDNWPADVHTLWESHVIVKHSFKVKERRLEVILKQKRLPKTPSPECKWDVLSCALRTRRGLRFFCSPCLWMREPCPDCCWTLRTPASRWRSRWRPWALPGCGSPSSADKREVWWR